MFQQALENLTPQTKVWTVSDLNESIKDLLEGQVGWVWLKGEISNFKCHSSGHLYFSLKDEKSQIRAVFFKHQAQKLKVSLQDGMEILVWGQLSVYTPRGEYQIYVQNVEPVGAGWLQQQFEMLKKKLAQEGLFDPKRKRPIPKRPKGIALITSPTGAAIRDMLSILQRRSASIPVYLIPALVQGDQAPEDLSRALDWAFRMTPWIDVIIIGRGGGSIEDLWAFNDEKLVRKIASSPVPVISAVGHEVDVTLCDFVADLRAPTPSAAAELVAMADWQWIEIIQKWESQLRGAWQHYIRLKWQRFDLIRLRLKDPLRKIQELLQRNDELVYRLTLAQKRHINQAHQRLAFLTQRILTYSFGFAELKAQLKNLLQRLQLNVRNQIKQARQTLEHIVALLDQVSPLKVMARGYSILISSDGQIIRSVHQVKINDTLMTQLSDGILIHKIENVLPERSFHELIRK